MKGIIFNFLEQFIIENVGEEWYEEILAKCPLETTEPFVGPGSYPDEDLMAIIDMTVKNTGIRRSETLRAFGRFCLAKLVERYPEFTLPHNHPKPFLMTVDFIHHIEVKKLYPNAEPPSFACEDPAPDRLIILYNSKRRLCHFMEGLIDGVADLYGFPIKHTQRSCMHDGAETCEFELTFMPEVKTNL